MLSWRQHLEFQMIHNPMKTGLLDKFDQELEVEYRGELYRVRDNGAVSRRRKSGQRKRPLDDIWTFGSANVLIPGQVAQDSGMMSPTPFRDDSAHRSGMM